jgi:hypothetical protein
MFRLWQWAQHERLLEPLRYLQGVKEAKVTGCVTEEWAVWLEKAILSDKFQAPQFVLPHTKESEAGRLLYNKCCICASIEVKRKAVFRGFLEEKPRECGLPFPS